jgi:hypothetical protein
MIILKITLFLGDTRKTQTGLIKLVDHAIKDPNFYKSTLKVTFVKLLKRSI